MSETSPAPGREGIQHEGPLVKVWHEVVSRTVVQTLVPSLLTTDQGEFMATDIKDKVAKFSHNVWGVVEATGYIMTPFEPASGLTMLLTGKMMAKRAEGQTRRRHRTAGSEDDSAVVKVGAGILDGPVKALFPSMLTTGDMEGKRYKDFVAKASKVEIAMLMATAITAASGNVDVAMLTGTGYLLTRFATLTMESADRTMPKWKERVGKVGKNVGRKVADVIGGLRRKKSDMIDTEEVT
jgi:hypothetical protein